MSQGRLIVKNLAKNIDEARLSDVFSKHGQLTDCRVIRDKKTKESRRFAFIGFKDSKCADAAMKYVDKSFIGTCKVSVELAASLGEGPVGPSVRDSINQKPEHAPVGPASPSNPFMEAFVDAMTHKKGAKVWADDSVAGTVNANFSEDEDDVNDIVVSSNPEPLLTQNLDKIAFNTGLDDLAYLKGHVVSGWDSDDDDDPVEIALPPESNQIRVEDDRVSVESSTAVSDSVAVEPAVDSQQADGILDTGRIRIVNLPYTTSKDAIETYFKSFGPVRETHICLDDDTKRSRGFAFVTFAFPEHALRALNAASHRGLSFEGRIIRVEEARNLPGKVLDIVAQKKSFKQRKEEERRKNAQKQDNTWNLLYVSANSAAAAMADTLGVSKAEMMNLNGDSDDLAVRVAIGETEVIRRTAEWLKSEGIRVNAFERKGESLLTAKGGEIQRSNSVIIVKHLPVSDIDAGELRGMFSKYGELLRFSICPSKTVAIVQFCDDSSASKCFSSLAFRRYRSVPLYLEWAPEDVFSAVEENRAAMVAEKPIEAEAATTSLFVKNIDFGSTELSLSRTFGTEKGFVKSTLMMKTAPNGDRQSMGYGFAEFSSPAAAQNAIKKLQGCNLDGKTLQLKLSEGRNRDSEPKSGPVPAIDSGAFTNKASNRLCIRNVPFEANRIELKQLFSAYGNVVSVRIPKKTGENQHRGFAFVEFLSKSDAMRAMETLQHTHIYGRKLVIEPADAESVSVEDVRSKTAKRVSLRDAQVVTESKRRKLNSEID
jgi:multiple RNA-binding domain-containing protein 1